MEEKIKNRIIAISGEPVSGKGTTIKAIVEKLKNEYQEENIHVISTGNEFRNLFSRVIQFIKNIDNKDKLKEIAKDELISQILNSLEYRQILENTILNIKKSEINIDEISSISQVNNSDAFKDIRHVIDTIIDDKTKKMGEEINSEKRPNEIWIFDSRMAFDNIPAAFSVRLTTNPKEAAIRLFNDSTRGNEDKYQNIKEAEKYREERRIGEIKRYKQKYGVNLENPENYDLIIDTSYADVNDVADTILLCEKEYAQNKPFGKTWASPLLMIPCQTLGETWEPQIGSVWNLQEMEQEIRKNGYYPDKEIEIFKIDGINYILEGHHRNFACIRAGKTLIPYIDLMQFEEGKERYKNGRYPSSRKNYLFDHEDMVERFLRINRGDKTLKFSYADIYPNILEKLSDSVNRGENR